MFLDWKNQYNQDNCTTQCSLQIQCKLYQITNSIFFFTELEQNFTICVETQETTDSQSDFQKEKCSWRNWAPCLPAQLQSYSYANCMVLPQKQKCRSME